MNTCPWDMIDNFQSQGEFDRFLRWLDGQVADGIAHKTVVKQPYLGANTFKEAWFEHVGSGQLWRLVWPDFPFTGLFAPVSSPQ